MERKTKVLVILGTVVVLAGVGYYVADRYFLPQKTIQVNEATPAATIVISQGTFDGRAGHQASGTVKLLRAGMDNYLRFEGFEMTAGPDVHFYLTPSRDPTSNDEIGAGLLLSVDGVEDGRADKRGDFNILLPTGIDLSKYHGVGAWCDRFNVPFGTASLA